MANVATALREEIIRLARKELRKAQEPLRKAVTSHRHEIAALKRELAAVNRLVSRLDRERPKAAVVEDSDGASSIRFSAKGLKTLRTKLGLSAEKFGHLAGVSGQSIYAWESGKTSPRSSQLPAIAVLRSMGKREAQARLAELEGGKAAKPNTRRKRKTSKASRS